MEKMERRDLLVLAGAVIASAGCSTVTGGHEETYTAVVDRIHQDQAILLLESNGQMVREEHVDISVLPPQAKVEGVVVEVTFVDGAPSSVRYLETETRRRRSEALNRLQNRT